MVGSSKQIAAWFDHFYGTCFRRRFPSHRLIPNRIPEPECLQFHPTDTLLTSFCYFGFFFGQNQRYIFFDLSGNKDKPLRNAEIVLPLSSELAPKLTFLLEIGNFVVTNPDICCNRKVRAGYPIGAVAIAGAIPDWERLQFVGSKIL